jgi:hypothetical protein
MDDIEQILAEQAQGAVAVEPALLAQLASLRSNLARLRGDTAAGLAHATAVQQRHHPGAASAASPRDWGPVELCSMGRGAPASGDHARSHRFDPQRAPRCEHPQPRMTEIRRRRLTLIRITGPSRSPFTV